MLTETKRQRPAEAPPDLSRLPPDALLTRRQLSMLTGFTVQTFILWERNGRGPQILRVENLPRYRAADVRAWLGQADARS